MLKESEKARADFNVDTALADGVAVVRMFLADRLGWYSRARRPWTALTTPCAN
ncbi:hypothetical protein [Streptomyces sp. NPDC004134]|uniref:hypothetical protein n=1 Tax=Streptomyces sp. NPDC004134 TaxID=3364691 RepID=UPI00367FA0E8